MIVTFVIVSFFGTVVAGTVILREVAGRAVAHVEIELLTHGFCVGSYLDGDYCWVVIALGENVRGNQFSVLHFHFHSRRLGTLSANDGDLLGSNGHHFSVVIHEGNLNLTVLCDEEFRVGLDFHDHSSVIGSLNSVLTMLCVVVIFFDCENRGRNHESADYGGE